MPVFPNRVPNLQQIGPIVEIVIFPSQPIFLKMMSEGKNPPSKKVIALIDTGASGSCINDPIAKELGLIARDVISVHTPSGTTQQPIYDLGFALPSLTNNVFPVQALGADLEKQPYAALIGRDILSICTLIYNGWDNSYQLHI
ncbi:MAG TPA: aspartyl protease family protein [Williamwhitmania sp.]|nr:aspartyl protease family protein [Williamwhitmania sp.]